MHLLLCKDLRHGYEPIDKVQALRLLQTCINKKTILPVVTLNITDGSQ